jgi:hypothetical protein
MAGYLEAMWHIFFLSPMGGPKLLFLHTSPSDVQLLDLNISPLSPMGGGGH